MKSLKLGVFNVLKGEQHEQRVVHVGPKLLKCEFKIVLVSVENAYLFLLHGFVLQIPEKVISDVFYHFILY